MTMAKYLCASYNFCDQYFVHDLSEEELANSWIKWGILYFKREGEIIERKPCWSKEDDIDGHKRPESAWTYEEDMHQEDLLLDYREQ